MKKLILPVILIVLIYGFYISPDFKTIAAGVAIFLYGMTYLEDGFKVFAGGVLEQFLKSSTNKLYKSISFGFVTTTIVQSSSLVSLLSISFLSAGFIGLYQGIGIMLGSNIGTTTGAWLMAMYGLKIKISAYAMPMIVIGFILGTQSKKSYKGIGYILAGLGFLFLGIHYMKEGFEVLSQSIDFASFSYGGYLGLFIFAGLGIGATVVMQSSHATIILTLTALAASQISYFSALALVLGANVGTTITAILGSIGSNSEAKKLAGAHFISKFFFTLVILVFIYPLIDLIDYMSGYIYIGDEDYALKVALFNTIINIIGLVIVLPFINPMIKFLNMVFPVKEDEFNKVSLPKYINKAALSTKETIFEVLLKETSNLYDKAFLVICMGLHVDRKEAKETSRLNQLLQHSKPQESRKLGLIYSKRVKPIYSAIIDFATLAGTKLDDEDSDKIYRIKLANRRIVHTVKMVRELQRNIVKYSNSSNKHMVAEYNNIRFEILNLLKEIYGLEDIQDHPNNVYKQLKILKREIKKNDIATNGVLDKLIRQNLIDSDMASSLINDIYYTNNALMNLIDMAGIIYIDIKNPLFAVESKLKLDEKEVRDLEKTMNVSE
ncbi:MAG: Sodium-dependent phosphate transporter [uncultured Campylobacterales bacterium]|uniref:Sodium-dependent phosphate transporter n=1 Tax=uncultured Campylobacterales bacterium TaxID=352960 RepID=A0A6S6T7P5_9BACT|nr:MAG: Sodium-dependent phosphate transporter [uncultured Campylobacterales bacterium]